MTRSGLGTQAALSLRLIAAIGYSIPIVMFCFCVWGLGFFGLFVFAFWCLCFRVWFVAVSFSVMEWYHRYVHNEPGSLSQYWLHLQ